METFCYNSSEDNRVKISLQPAGNSPTRITVFGYVFWEIRSKYEILSAENRWQVASWNIWYFHPFEVWFWLGYLQMNCSKMSPWSSPTGITQFGYVFWEIRSKYEVMSARFCDAVIFFLLKSKNPSEYQFVKIWILEYFTQELHVMILRFKHFNHSTNLHKNIFIYYK